MWRFIREKIDFDKKRLYLKIYLNKQFRKKVSARFDHYTL